MTENTIYIAFRGSQVAVSSNIPEVVERVKNRFCKMLAPMPPSAPVYRQAGTGRQNTNAIRRLEVFRRGEKYYLLGCIETNGEGRPLASVLRYLNREVICHLIKANPNFLWLHAGAAVYQGNAVVFTRPWGRGKSTLITNLCESGWSYMSDDILPLDIKSGKVIPFPQTPFARNNNGKEVPSYRLKELRKIDFILKQEGVCKEPMPICAIVFPVYIFKSQTKILPCSPSTAVLELLQRCLNFENHQEEAVQYICELSKSLPTLSLTFSNGKLAAKQIAQEHENWHSSVAT